MKQSPSISLYELCLKPIYTLLCGWFSASHKSCAPLSILVLFKDETNLNVLLFPVEVVPTLSRKHELGPTNSLFPGIYNNNVFYCVYFNYFRTFVKPYTKSLEASPGHLNKARYRVSSVFLKRPGQRTYLTQLVIC
jgi:hypothetical protein